MNLRSLALVLFVCAAASAQTTLPGFVAFRESVLTASPEIITVQQPESPTRTIVFDSASVYCSVACNVSIERDGTAATATTFTIHPVASDSGPATAVAFRSSDAGVGTVLYKHSLLAGETMAFDLKGMRLPKIAGANVTIRISTITGTARVGLKHMEQQ